MHQSTGYALHIGVDHLNPDHYSTLPPLKAAVKDAVYWESFALSQQYPTGNIYKLHNEEATVDAVKLILQQIAGKMHPGDILLLTYAGHGSQILNQKQVGLDLEPYDQTWCLYDRQLLDDELYECFEAFLEGTRIVVVSDSCHSGTITRAVNNLSLTQLLDDGILAMRLLQGMQPRNLSEASEKFTQANHDIYSTVVEKYKSTTKGENVKAAVKLFAACQDNQTTLDGEENGIFTEAFRIVLAQEKHQKSNSQDLIAAVSALYHSPNPNYFEYGAIIPGFDHSFPFNINIENPTEIIGHRPPNIPIPPPEKEPPLPPAGWLTKEVPLITTILSIEFSGNTPNTPDMGDQFELIREETEPATGITRWIVEAKKFDQQYGWSAAHALQTSLTQQNYNVVVEPVVSASIAPTMPGAREADHNSAEYKTQWPPSTTIPKVPIGWHLDIDHSQLTKAQQTVWEQPDIKPSLIAQFDTGYFEGHVAMPPHIRLNLQRNYMKGETPTDARDRNGGQDLHGMGTLALLAGGKVEGQHTFDEFTGYIGGAPFAQVIPIRISDSVAILNSDNFCKAVEYAIAQQCDVITMSMAGKPDRRMAKMVNEAYEAGIVIVSAASNCWYDGGLAELAPNCVLFPAAFERVIAATGATYTHQPYDRDFILDKTRAINIETKYMQGCWGPKSRMKKALAAYTPNVAWASDHFTFTRNGGGTSSATPQIAAAAALWIAYHRKELEKYNKPGQKWKKVEAVRHALFTSAAKEEVFTEYEKYYGNGILRASAALEIGVIEIQDHQKAPEANTSWWGLIETARSFILNRPWLRSNIPAPSDEALAQELLHVLYSDPKFAQLFSELDLTDKELSEKIINDAALIQDITASPFASGYLKEKLKV